MSDVIRVEGLTELERSLKLVGDELPREVRAALFDGAMIVARGATRNAPVGNPSTDPHPGALAKSIRARASLRGAEVVAGSRAVPYAGPIQWGWAKRNIPASKFLTRAFDDAREAVIDLVNRRLNELWRKVR